MPRGGHRFWIAPEVQPDTYAPDNLPVQVAHEDGRISFLQPPETLTSLQKQITISVEQSGEFSIAHGVKNCGITPRLLAPWALTALAPGGTAVTLLPRPQQAMHDPLQPTHQLVMWSYTDFRDPRWTFFSKYFVLRQDANARSPQKVGLFNEHSFSCYLLGTVLFVKRSYANPSERYPDFQSSVELFTNGDFLELETLGPLIELQPGCSVEHWERWYLFRDVHISDFTEAELDRVLLPILEQTR